DPRALGELLSCGCVLESRSLFKGVDTVPAATASTFKEGIQVRQRRYFVPGEWEIQSKLEAGEFHSALRESLDRAVRRCVASIAPMGVSLTGGFDTRLIMACLKSRDVTPPCYTFGGMYRDCFDVKIARKVAELCGCEHQVLQLGTPFLRSFPELAEQTI